MQNRSTNRIARIQGIMATVSGLTNTAAPRARKALDLLDDTRVSSIPGVVQAYLQRAAAIHADGELSDSGKSTRIQAQASSAFGNVASAAREIALLEAEHRAEMQTAAVIPVPTVNDTLIDLELARQIKEAAPTLSKLDFLSERTRQALARIPLELSGLSAEAQARVTSSLIPNADAARFSDEAAAIAAARDVAQAAIDELQPVAKWTPRELVQHIGADSGYRLPGVVQSLADRLGAEKAEEGAVNAADASASAS